MASEPNGLSEASNTVLTLGSPVVNLQVAPRAADKDLAALSAAVYDPAVVKVGSWTRLAAPDLLLVGIEPTALEDPASGFRAGLYAHEKREHGHVLAMAGTDMTSIKDWMTNLGQGLGLDTAQYREALAVAQDAKRAFGNDLTLTGHSLGGGLAAAAAAAIDAPAVTFNAAGVSSHTLTRQGLDPDNVVAKLNAGQIRSYSVAGEVLTSLQNALPIPKAPGYKIILEDPAPLSTVSRFVPGASAYHSLSLHGMASVTKALDKDWRVSLASSAPERGPHFVAADAWLTDPVRAAAQHPELRDEMRKASQALSAGVSALQAGGATEKTMANVQHALSQRLADNLEHGKPIQLASLPVRRQESPQIAMER